MPILPTRLKRQIQFLSRISKKETEKKIEWFSSPMELIYYRNNIHDRPVSDIIIPTRDAWMPVIRRSLDHRS